MAGTRSFGIGTLQCAILNVLCDVRVKITDLI